jgi:hypothetical protein
VNIASVKNAIDNLAAKPATLAEKDLRAAAIKALKYLQKECIQLQQEANDYPVNSVNADVLFGGYELDTLAANLAAELKQRQQYDLEEKALTFRCMAVLAVQSHYHHVVGPAMLARAECNERLGNTELASHLYQAVIADFAWIVEEYDKDDCIINDNDRISLQCLNYAIEHKLVIQPDISEADDLKNIFEKCNQVLSRI